MNSNEHICQVGSDSESDIKTEVQHTKKLVKTFTFAQRMQISVQLKELSPKQYLHAVEIVKVNCMN